MSFEVAGNDYDRFMGRYSRLFAPQLADFAGIASGQRVIDVGCGPGALTRSWSRGSGRRRGRHRPVGAVHRRAAGAAAGRRGRQAPAEELPFATMRSTPRSRSWPCTS